MISVPLTVASSPLKKEHVCVGSSPRISDPQLYENSTDLDLNEFVLWIYRFYRSMIFYVIFLFC